MANMNPCNKLMRKQVDGRQEFMSPTNEKTGGWPAGQQDWRQVVAWLNTPSLSGVGWGENLAETFTIEGIYLYTTNRIFVHLYLHSHNLIYLYLTICLNINKFLCVYIEKIALTLLLQNYILHAKKSVFFICVCCITHIFEEMQ